jgi:ubiquitin C-terminal hydrolase
MGYYIHKDLKLMADYIVYDPKYVPAEFGLNNTGVICWCNSILQLLLSCPSLNKTLLECEEELRDNRFATEYINLLKILLPNEGPNGVNLSTISIYSAKILNAFMYEMKRARRNFSIGRSQECVDEALTLFIDMFNCQKVNKLFLNSYELIIKCTGCNKQVSTVRDNSYRIELFCEKKFNSVEDFCTYIRYHPSEHDEYTCECGFKMKKFLRVEKLKMLREIVVIIFNKFQAKDNRWFPTELEFNSTNGKKLKYKLVAQIEHGGTMHGGHYKSKGVRGDKVCGFNDSSVYADALGPTPSTYMIAYHLSPFEPDMTA